jgi:hypothetical protein
MPHPLVGSELTQSAGRRGASVKTLKRMLKKAGLKVSGKKSTLTRRAKKAHLKMGGAGDEVAPMMGGRRRAPRGGVEEIVEDIVEEKLGGRRRKH